MFIEIPGMWYCKAKERDWKSSLVKMESRGDLRRTVTLEVSEGTREGGGGRSQSERNGAWKKIASESLCQGC